jgi:hypothetical protein
MNKTILSILIILIQLPMLHSLDIRTLFTEKQLTQINNAEIVSRMFVKYNAKKENTDLSIDIPEISGLDPLIRQYEIKADERFLIPVRQFNPLNFYRTLQSYSKLNGMKYYSRSSDKIETFITEAYTIDTPDRRKKIDDYQPESITDHTVRYFMEKDNKFGKLAYRADIYYSQNHFTVITRCLDSLSSVNQPEETVTIQIYSFVPDQGLYGYSGSFIRIRNEMLLKIGFFRPTTFSNRLRAATVHLAGSLGFDWTSYLNPWDEKKLKEGYYRNYKL